MIAIVLSVVFMSSQVYRPASAQVICSNPLIIGELRVYQSKLCVDIPSSDGAGSIQTYLCDGEADQQIILCGDGTIRNEAKNYCFTPTGTGNSDVTSSPCQHYPEIPDSQKWRIGRTKAFTDVGGIVQEGREIINVASGKCLDVSGYDGHGSIGVFDCENLNDQYFYFRSRGKLLARGRLRNEKSNQCLDVSGNDGKGDVSMYNCEDKSDQWFRYYQNGEVVNEKSRQCLDVKGYAGKGNIQMYACEDLVDQMWLRPTSLCNGEYCSFVNKKSRECLDVAGTDGRGGVGTYSCEGLADQRLKFVSEKWTPPTAKWVRVGCNQNGHVSQSLSNTISFSSTITATIATEVSASIESDLKFAKASVSTKVSTSLSSAWTQSYSGTKTVTFACDYYDNQEAFAGGCMWQLQVVTQEVLRFQLLKWNPLIIRCTRTTAEPICPPFTKCVDKDCSLCQEI